LHSNETCTKMCAYTTFLCTKSDNTFPLYGTYTLRWKEENKESKPIFESLYLGNARHDLVEIWNVGYWVWRASPQQKLSGFVQSARSFVYVKILLLFFLSIYLQVWCIGFLGNMTHYHVFWLLRMEYLYALWRSQSLSIYWLNCTQGTKLQVGDILHSINFLTCTLT